MGDLISKLSKIRSEYNYFDVNEEPYYRALSEAIKILSQRADGDTISRQEALKSPVKMVSEGLDWIPVYHIKQLPTAQLDLQLTCNNLATDTISRQAAIDEICLAWCGRKYDDCVHISDFKLGCYWCDGCSDVQAIMDLPPAQSERKMRCNFCNMSICTLEGRPCSRQVVKE